VTGSRDGTAKVWSLVDGSCLATLRKGLSGTLGLVKFTYDRTRILVV
jgi:hypothetical protein